MMRLEFSILLTQAVKEDHQKRRQAPEKLTTVENLQVNYSAANLFYSSQNGKVLKPIRHCKPLIHVATY